MKDDAASEVDWGRVSRAFVHPIRLSILESMAEKQVPLSAVALRRADVAANHLKRRDLSAVGLSTVSYHVTALKNAGLIRKTCQRQIRGSFEKFYVLS